MPQFAATTTEAPIANKNESNVNATDDLAVALSVYQHRMGLNVTGVLDADTQAEMQKPRCGLPDIKSGDEVVASGMLGDPASFNESALEGVKFARFVTKFGKCL